MSEAVPVGAGDLGNTIDAVKCLYTHLVSGDFSHAKEDIRILLKETLAYMSGSDTGDDPAPKMGAEDGVDCEAFQKLADRVEAHFAKHQTTGHVVHLDAVKQEKAKAFAKQAEGIITDGKIDWTKLLTLLQTLIPLLFG